MPSCERSAPARFGSLAEVPTVDGLDGVEHLVGGIYSDRLDIDGSHLMTNVDLWPRPLVLVAGARSYSRLTAEQRRILRTAAANVVPKALDGVRNAEAEASGNICRRGGATFDAATSSELRALRLAVEPVYRDLERDPGTRAAIEAIERHKAELAEPPADLASCERAAEPPASGATAIDGVWRMDTDREAVDYDYYARELGALDLRVRPRQVRDHAGEPQGVHLGLRDIRRRRQPDVVDLHGRRRHRPDRGVEHAR